MNKYVSQGHVALSRMVVSIFLLFSVASTVQAELVRTGTYASGMYLSGTEDVDSSEENRGMLRAMVGKVMNENYSLEGHFGVVNASDGDSGIFTLSGYARFEKKLEKSALYGLVGITSFNVYDSDFDDINETGFSYGVGIDIFGSKFLAITLEYMKLIDTELDNGDDLSFDTIGVGLTYYFNKDNNNFARNGLGFGLIRE